MQGLLLRVKGGISVKFGVRKPNIKKLVASKTSGKSKLKAKKSITPTYGKKGTGAIKSPTRSTRNRIYNKGTKNFF
ncbi:hypothetical protein Thaha01_00181 [Tetragenococcus halophilus subsp. halophilus]